MSIGRGLARAGVGALLALVIAGVGSAADGAMANGVWSGPALVSPGGLGREGRVGTGCPSFSWAALPNAVAYEIAVYEVSQGGASHRPAEEALLRVTVPAGATTWTPESDNCLAPGRYGWVVGAVETDGAKRTTSWSRPAVFRVESGSKPLPQGPPPEMVGEAAAPPGIASTPLQSTSESGSGPRSVVGEAYVPPVCRAGGETFTDVPASDPFCHWIEQLARDGISDGCGAGKFCPDNAVTRRQLAAVVEKAMRGTAKWSPQQGSTIIPPPPAGAALTIVDDPAANLVGYYPSITIGADGLPIISHFDDTAKALKVTHCNDVACSGQDETNSTVDDPPANFVGYNPSITIGTDGLPIMSYFDDTAKALKVVHCDDMACAGQNETITTVDDPVVNWVGFHSSITIGADGRPIISYVDETAAALKVVHCDDVACAGQNETITTVDDPAVNSVGSRNSITIGADGLPIISYFDDTATALKVAHCDDAACTGQNETITTVDEPGLVGYYPSITIGVDGLPIISYFDDTAKALKVAHCNDLACAGQDETITTVDNPGLVGYYTSITIGADGLPIIAYFEDVVAALKVAHCNDVACAGQDETITTVDDPGLVGYYPSITIGADGLPIISYFDDTAKALKVAHCANALCVPFSRRHGDPGTR